MKLVMTLLVRDEADIIDATIRYHLEQGVDFIIATDNRSVDATTGIVRDYEQAGYVHYIHEPADDYSQGTWVTRMARLAALEHGADWVINSDADEFWFPDRGDLKSTLAELPPEAGLVHAERLDFVPVADDGRPFYDRMMVRNTESLNALGRRPQPKVAHRAHPQVIVHQGNHGVGGTELIPLSGAAPIEILHFPLRTYAQFENKILLGGRAYLRNRVLPVTTGDSWRYLYKLHERGGLRHYYEEKQGTENSVRTDLSSGVLVRDDRLQRFFVRLDTPTCLPGGTAGSATEPAASLSAESSGVDEYTELD